MAQPASHPGPLRLFELLSHYLHREYCFLRLYFLAFLSGLPQTTAIIRPSMLALPRLGAQQFHPMRTCSGPCILHSPLVLFRNQRWLVLAGEGMGASGTAVRRL